jgi:hypothetical protein
MILKERIPLFGFVEFLYPNLSDSLGVDGWQEIEE